MLGNIEDGTITIEMILCKTLVACSFVQSIMQTHLKYNRLNKRKREKVQKEGSSAAFKY